MVTEAKDKAVGLPGASFVFASLAITNTSVLMHPEALKKEAMALGPLNLNPSPPPAWALEVCPSIASTRTITLNSLVIFFICSLLSWIVRSVIRCACSSTPFFQIRSPFWLISGTLASNLYRVGARQGNAIDGLGAENAHVIAF